VRSRARSVERAFSELEHRLGRGPTDEELARHLDISQAELTRWLAAIASTTIGPLDRAIAAGAEPAALEGPGSGSPSAVVEDHELSQIMRAEIKKLPEREKLVLSLYYDEGLTLSEIGQVLGVTESRVSQIHTKSVLHLRSRLSAAGVG
jgi:RNA polymerase sigma factor for flagellar operon FliA